MSDAPEVEILAGAGSIGSGRLIAPSLVLTARHVLYGERGAAHRGPRVRLPQDGRERSSVIVWEGPDDLDAALLRVGEVADVEAARWGVFVGLSRGNHCEATGFPWAQETPDGWRDTEQLPLVVHLGTNRTSGLQANLDGPLPEPRPGGRRWAGLSGAALIRPHPDGDLVAGVLIEETPKYEAQRFTIVPASRLLADAGFRAHVRAATGTEPVAEPAEIVQLLVPPASIPAASPASLLRADVETVGFHGRETELIRLREWCRGAGRSFRVLTGPGGQGKTRLARRLAEELGRSGWTIGYLGPGRGEDAHGFDRLDRCGAPLFLIIDYAETRPDLIESLIAATGRTRAPIRILLLARSAGDWWDTLRTSSHAVGEVLSAAVVEELPGLLPESAEARRAGFVQAACDLSTALDELPGAWPHLSPSEVTLPDLTAPEYASPLAVQMAALALLLGNLTDREIRPGDAARGADEVILDHEQRYWTTTARTRELPVGHAAQSRAVAAAALCGASGADEAIMVLGGLPDLADQPHDVRSRVADWLAGLYPGPAGRHWGPLQPDRLGEFFVVRAIRDGWIAPAALLRKGSEAQARHALTVLARAAAHQNDASDHLQELLTALPELGAHAVVVAAQSRDPRVLIDPLSRVLDAGVAAPVYRDIVYAVPQQTTALRDFGLGVTATYADGIRQLLADNEHLLSELVRSLIQLGKRQMDVGRLDRSLAANMEALDLWEHLPVEEADANRPLLVLTLHNLGTNYISYGAPDQALRVLRNAESLSPEDEVSGTAANKGLRAMVLQSLTAALTALGREREGLEPAAAAVALFEGLVAVDTAEWSGQYALALSNHAFILTWTGSYAPALEQVRRAITLLRDLADTNPDAHLPTLAAALSTLATCRANAGDPAAALAPQQESVAILTSLTADGSLSYLPELADKLLNLSVNHSELGNHLAALATAETAVATERRHIAAIAGARDPELVKALNRLHNCLSALDRHDEALATAKEALAIQDRLLAGNPDLHLKQWVKVSFAKAAELNHLGRLAEAQDTTSQIVQRLRGPAEADAEQWARQFTLILYLDSRLLLKLNRIEEGIASAKEITAFYSRKAPHDVPGYLHAARTQFELLSDRPASDTDSLDLLERTTETCRHHLRSGVEPPEEFLDRFAEALNRIALARAAQGQHKGALSAAREAAHWARMHAATEPDEGRLFLSSMLNNLANRHLQLSECDTALGLYDEAIEIRTALAQPETDEYASDLAHSLGGRASCYSALGRHEEALRTLIEMVALLEKVRDPAPQWVNSLAEGLEQYSDVEALLGAARLRRGSDPARRLRTLNDLLWELIETLILHDAKTIDFLAAAGVPIGTELPLKVLGPYLSIVSRLLRSVGRPEWALATCEESISILRELAMPSQLGATLNEYSLMLADAERSSEALTATEEAVRILSALADEPSGALAVSRYNLALRYEEAGRAPEVLRAARQAADDYRELSATNPAFGPDLADTLEILLRCLIGSESLRYAIPVAEEALALRIRLARTEEPTAMAAVAAAQHNLALVLTREGSALEEALELVTRSQATLRPLPDEFAPQRLHSQWLHGQVLIRLNQIPDAVAPLVTGLAEARRLDYDLVQQFVQALQQAHQMAPDEVRTAYQNHTGEPFPF